MCRTCNWVTHRPELDLTKGNPAFLRVRTPAGEEFWIIQPIDGGFLVTEEHGIDPPTFGKSYRIETDFGPAVEHWTCSCVAYAYKGGRRQVRHGCLHCSALHAALTRIGLIAPRPALAKTT